mmetsp:Transcript_40188/g.94738  ORF Transcript_40188/g.94738 Transcript_40188/m.94738 type:complete len:271 (-) Transcript_40188:151-963(-)
MPTGDGGGRASALVQATPRRVRRAAKDGRQPHQRTQRARPRLPRRHRNPARAWHHTQRAQDRARGRRPDALRQRAAAGSKVGDEEAPPGVGGLACARRAVVGVARAPRPRSQGLPRGAARRVLPPGVLLRRVRDGAAGVLRVGRGGCACQRRARGETEQGVRWGAWGAKPRVRGPVQVQRVGRDAGPRRQERRRSRRGGAACVARSGAPRAEAPPHAGADARREARSRERLQRALCVSLRKCCGLLRGGRQLRYRCMVVRLSLPPAALWV